MSSSRDLTLREAFSQVARAIQASVPVRHGEDGNEGLSAVMRAASAEIQRCTPASSPPAKGVKKNS